MKKTSYILGFFLAISAASCSKVAPVKTIEEAKLESNVIESSAISTVSISDSDSGITDPENDEDHDREDMIKD